MDIITTRQVAALLAVSEATVKRWADAGTIRCFRTPGGHRKFRMSDVAEFLRANNYEAATPLPPIAEVLGSGVPVALPDEGSEGADGSVALRFRNMALSGDADGLVSLFAQQRLRGHSLASIFDDIATPALVDIGERWAKGTLTIVQEHLAAQTVIESLARIRPLIERPSAQRGKILLACPGEEQHDIALRMGALIAYGLGYTALMLGARSPVSDLALMVVGEKVKVVVLSFSEATAKESVAPAVDTIAQAAAGVGARVLVGGSGVRPDSSLPANAQYVRTLNELAVALNP